ncbi:MAG TPA: AMP-binding protein [Mycobacteriales bacterium]|nr:AMP-binding protein [Mycobacteriales bacterium]
MGDTFADLLLARADDDRVALWAGDLTWSWRTLVAESRARAAVLTERRDSARPHVGVLLDNTPEYLAWLYGAALARGTVVGINPTRRGAPLREDIQHTDCGMIVTDSAHRDLLDGLGLGLDPARLLVVDDQAYLDEVATARADDRELPAAEPGDRLLLLFTSGSTGAPKAVVCTTGRLAVIAKGAVDSIGVRADDVFYQAMPMFHGNAIMANLAPAVALGVPVELRSRFSASQFLSDVRRHDATYFNYVGRSLAYVLATPQREDDRTNSLRLGFGTEASQRDRAEFERRFGCALTESYGSSEGVVATHRPPGTPANSIGVPRPRPGSDVAVVDPATGRECAVAVVDGDGRLQNPGAAIGEVVDRGGAPGFEGYYRNDAATSSRLRDGWYWTGDFAYRDADGWLYFAGRSNDWLRVDSENFAAAPVEAVLSRFFDAVMVAVYAVPDPRTGDEVMCAIEPRPGASFDPVAFGAFLQAQPDLGTKWAPRFVRIVDAMPLTATNKVDKAPLRASGWAAGAVWWRPGAELAYVPFGEADRATYQARFEEHGRTDLLPAPQQRSIAGPPAQ